MPDGRQKYWHRLCVSCPKCENAMQNTALLFSSTGILQMEVVCHRCQIKVEKHVSFVDLICLAVDSDIEMALFAEPEVEHEPPD